MAALMDLDELTGNPDPLVVLGERDADDLRLRARISYTSASRPPLPRARPFLVGDASLEPLLDRALGANHVIRGRYEGGTRSLLHTHDADQYLVITAGEGEVRTETDAYQLRPGMVVLIPRGQPHIHVAGPDFLEYILFTATGHQAEVLD